MICRTGTQGPDAPLSIRHAQTAPLAVHILRSDPCGRLVSLYHVKPTTDSPLQLLSLTLSLDFLVALVFLCWFFFVLAMLPANLLLPSLISASSAAALSPLLGSWQARPHIPYIDEPDDTMSVFHVSTHQEISSYKETYYFDQLIDHNNPKLGTFKQRYWHNYEFYEPGTYSETQLGRPRADIGNSGGTIVLGTPGEVNAEGTPFSLHSQRARKMTNGYFRLHRLSHKLNDKWHHRSSYRWSDHYH